MSMRFIIGHGTAPEVLQHTRWNDWLISARRAFDRLNEIHERVFILGFSMGGLLSIVIAQSVRESPVSQSCRHPCSI